MPFLLSPAAPASAQTNPTADACGLPLRGSIQSSVTYTLIADCTLTHRISCSKSADADTQVTLTVIGGGNTINARNDGSESSPVYWDVFRMSRKCALSLSNVTINGGGSQSTAAVSMTNSDFASSFTNVTFTNSVYNALLFDDQREDAPGTTHTLNNVLIEDATGTYVGAGHGYPSGIQVLGKVNLNINNLALRNVRGGNAAIGANETYLVGVTRSLGTITLSGCLTVDGVFPRVIYGNFVDNTTVPCSDPVGNRGSAAMQYPPAPQSACGLPLSGFIYGTRTFNLNGHCALSGPLYIPYESSVVINGNRFTIDAAAAGAQAIAVAGRFSLNNAVISGAAGSPVVTYLDKTMSIANAEFRGNGGPLIIQDSAMSLNTVLIENHSVSAATSPSAIQVSKSAQVNIRDSVISSNSGGVGALHSGAPFSHPLIGAPPGTTLAGCITFASNSPADIADPNGLLTDNRTGACPADMIFLAALLSQAASGNNPHNPHNSPIASCDGPAGAVAMGASACVFRFWWNGDAVAQIYEINQATAEGFHKLTVTQRQVDAVDGERIVAVSPDGRALVVAWPDDNVTIKFGPNPEGKILHVTFAGGLHGPVLGSLSTYGPAPGLPYIGLALPLQIQPGQAPQPAQPSIAQFDCMVTTKNILNLRDAPDGDVMFFIPYDVTLTAFERTGQWFQVDYHGDRGWLHADYVRPQGSCG